MHPISIFMTFENAPPRKNNPTEHTMKRSSLCLLVICLSLLSAGPFAAAKAPRPSKGDVQIEISITGIIQKTGMSFCMDGAKYQILHVVNDPNGGGHSTVTRIMTSN